MVQKRIKCKSEIINIIVELHVFKFFDLLKRIVASDPSKEDENGCSDAIFSFMQREILNLANYFKFVEN